MAEFQNPCGGLRWRNLPSGLIEVENEGVPVVQTGSRQERMMLAAWDNWGTLLSQAARKHDVPVAWLLAIASMETGFLLDARQQAAAVSPAGARGVMQIMPATGKGFGVEDPEQLFVPAVNIDVAARLVAQLNKPERGGLPGLSAVYNSGRLCTTDPNRNEWMLYADANYPRRVIEWNNTALLSGLVTFSPRTIVLLGAAVGTALALVLGTR